MSVKILGTTFAVQENEFAASRKVLWPCYEYTIGVDGLPFFGDNVLESVILQLYHAGEKDAGRLSYLTGMDQDLVLFLQDRLLQKNWIDSFGNLTDEGLAKFELNQKPRTDFYHIYRDALSGKLVPGRIFPNESTPYIAFADSDIVTDRNSGRTIFSYREISTAGTESLRPVEIPVLSYDKRSYSQLKEDEVIQLVHRAFSESGSSVLIPASEQDDDATAPEPSIVYIMIDIGIAKGNISEWICTDGFRDLSPFFTQNIACTQSETNRTVLQELRANLQKDNLGEIKQEGKAKGIKKIQEKTLRVKKAVGLLDSPPTSTDEKNTVYDKAKEDCVAGSYALLEETFFLYLSQYVVLSSEAEQTILDCRNKFEIKELLTHTAKRIGFNFQADGNDDIGYLFQLDKGSFKSAMTDSPSMFPLIGLMLLVADKDAGTVMTHIAKDQPHFLLDIAEAKSLRDRILHADSVTITAEYAKSFAEKALHLVNLYFGHCIPDSGQQMNNSAASYEWNNLNAALGRLETDFGLAVIRKLPSDITRCLRLTELCGSEPDISPEVVLRLYELFGLLFVLMQQSATGNTSVGKWQERARRTGFRFEKEQIVPLERTNPRRVTLAMEKKSVSTQANCIAWLCQSSDAELQRTAKLFPYLLVTVSRIAELRKHGEIPESGFTGPELSDMKKCGIEFVKFMAGEGFFEQNCQLR